MQTSSNIRVQKIADIPYYTEGPATDSKGNIYCTTLTGEAILKIDAQNKITEWAQSACPNGQVILPNDEHLICDVTLEAVRRFDSSGNFIKNEVEGYCSGAHVYSPK